MTSTEGDPNIRLVQIVDPIAGYQNVIDTVSKVAHWIRVPHVSPPMLRSGLDPNLSLPSIEDMSLESFHRDNLRVQNHAKEPPRITSVNIGNRTIEGIPTRGVRTIMEYSARSPVRLPVIISTEAWVSDERKVVVLSNRHDAQWGDSTSQLVRAGFEEPDESLFPPPRDFRIVDEPGAFNVDIPLPAQSPASP